jgi:hypothetical protein
VTCVKRQKKNFCSPTYSNQSVARSECTCRLQTRASQTFASHNSQMTAILKRKSHKTDRTVGWVVDWEFLGKTALNATLFSSLFPFMYFRSSARRRFPLQFDLIVINGGTDEIF